MATNHFVNCVPKILCKASLYSFNIPITNKPSVALTENNNVSYFYRGLQTKEILLHMHLKLIMN